MYKKLTPEWDRTQDLNQRIADKNQRWLELARKGGGSSHDLTEADFGQGGPKGLDITPWPETRIDIKSIKDDEEYTEKGFFGRRKHLKKFAGYVPGGDDTQFYMQPRYFRNSTLSTMLRKLTGLDDPPPIDTLTFGHENIHIHQHALNKIIPDLYAGHNQYVAFQEIPEHNGKLDKWWTTLKRARWDHIAGGRPVLTQIFSKEKGFTISDYYALNNEMQARMHEIISTGYLQWETMPATKTEFWAAFHNMGVETPDAIIKHLQESEEGKAALEKFAVHPSIESIAAHTVSKFNAIQVFLDSDALTEAVWNKHYPLLYGELLEYYGDGPGRARMEAGVNPRPVLEVLTTVMNAENELTEEELLSLSNSIPASLATLYINNLNAYDYNYTEEQRDDLMAIAKKLLQRDDVKEAMFAPAHIDTDVATSIFTYMPLFKAILEGKMDIAEMLLEAGAPIDQTCCYVSLTGKKNESFQVTDITKTIESHEEMLSDPSKVHRKARKNFFKPENLEDFKIKHQFIKDTYAFVMAYHEKAPDTDIDYDDMPELSEI